MNQHINKAVTKKNEETHTKQVKYLALSQVAGHVGADVETQAVWLQSV